MSMLRRILFCVSMVAGVFALSAQQPAAALSTEDVLFEIVSYYNPQLAESRQLIDCIAPGGAVDECANQFVSTQARQNPDVQRMLEVMDAYQREQWLRVVQLAGVGVACSWVGDFDGKEALCSGFGEAVYAAINLASDAPGAVLSTVGAIVDALPCFYDCDSEGFDAAAEWQRCYASKMQEGIHRRLGAGDWTRWVRGELPTHRFTPGSLYAACYPQLVEIGPAATRELFDRMTDGLAEANHPMLQEYIRQVEAAALASIDEPASDYANLQTLWTARPDPQARAALITLLTQATAPSIATLTNAQRSECMQTFNTPTAHVIEKWAIEGRLTLSNATSHGINGDNWVQRNPQTWCNSYYATTFNQILTTRKTAYDEALTRGCHTNGRAPNPLQLQCPALGGGMQRCHTALDNVHGAQCALIPLVLRPVPQQPPPNAAETPPAATTTAPPQAREPQLRTPPSTILVPPATTSPALETTQATPG